MDRQHRNLRTFPNRHRRLARTESQLDPLVWANLPWQLLELILSRLPLDDIARFRLVSGDWNKFLRSWEFSKTREIVHQGRPDGCWILAAPEKFVSTKLCDTSSQGLHRIKVQGMREIYKRHGSKSSSASIRGNRGLISDGGLVFYNELVMNVLTGSQRRLHYPLYDGLLKLSAVTVNKSTNFYKAMFHAEELAGEGSRSSYLIIYDSNEKSWRRTQSSPSSLQMADSAVVCNDRIHFALDTELATDGSVNLDDRALTLISYDLTNETGL